MKYLLGVDLGTTAIKIGIFTDQGAKVATATEDYDLLTPAPLHVEQPAQAYWESFSNAMRNVLAKAGIDANEIAALSISAQGETLVCLDENNNPLQNFIVWLDNRAQAEAKYLEERFSQSVIHRATGQSHIVALSPGAKILWLKRHKPELFQKAKKFLLIEDYFFFRLGGVFRGEGSLWCTSHMWDINTRDWWQPMLDELGITREQLPQLAESGTPIGNMLPGVAAELGLPGGLPLVMGGLDQACGCIGVGNVKPGAFSESTGSALVCCTMTDKIIIDEVNHLPCFYTAIPNLYMVHTFGSGGIAYKWLRDALCEKECQMERSEGKNAYAEMDRLAQDIPAASDGLVVLPHFQGAGPPDTDQYAKCAIYGLSLMHTRGHVIRGFMEGVAVNVYRMVETAQELMGFGIGEVISLSGGAKSDLWCQIKADVLGKPVVTMKNTQDAACLGAAILAGFGIGIFDSIPDTALAIVGRDKTYEPNPGNRAVYDELIARYKLLTKTLKPVTSKL